MKCPIFLPYAIGLLLISTNVVFAGTTTLTTYYPAPSGKYNTLRLVPQAALSGPCDPGTLYVDNSGTLQYCDGSAVWGNRSMVWNETGNYIYPADTVSNPNLNVGIGVTGPGQKLDVAGNIKMSGVRTKLFYRGDNDSHIGSLGLYSPDGGTTLIMTPYDSNGNNVAVSQINLGGFGSFDNNTVGLAVSGNTHIAGNATVDGNATIPTISGNTHITGNATVDGNATIPTISGNTHITGDATVDGSVTASGFFYSSDRRLKKDVRPLTHALDKVQRLNGVAFTWKKNNVKDIGVIAQNVESVLPELVSTGKDGMKSVEYGNLTAVLIEAVKEQQKEIEGLKKKVAELQNKRLAH